MARGIAYYTGMLFDIYSGEDEREILGGGGRYDGLTRALGYDRDVSSLGFAYNLDAVLVSLEQTPDQTSETVLVSAAELGSITAAVEKARKLRSAGKRAAIDFENSRSTSDGQEVK